MPQTNTPGTDLNDSPTKANKDCRALISSTWRQRRRGRHTRRRCLGCRDCRLDACHSSSGCMLSRQCSLQRRCECCRQQGRGPRGPPAQGCSATKLSTSTGLRHQGGVGPTPRCPRPSGADWHLALALAPAGARPAGACGADRGRRQPAAAGALATMVPVGRAPAMAPSSTKCRGNWSRKGHGHQGRSLVHSGSQFYGCWRPSSRDQGCRRPSVPAVVCLNWNDCSQCSSILFGFIDLSHDCLAPIANFVEDASCPPALQHVALACQHCHDPTWTDPNPILLLRLLRHSLALQLSAPAPSSCPTRELVLPHMCLPQHAPTYRRPSRHSPLLHSRPPPRMRRTYPLSAHSTMPSAHNTPYSSPPPAPPSQHGLHYPAPLP